jgi:hypothetical protein
LGEYKSHKTTSHLKNADYVQGQGANRLKSGIRQRSWWMIILKGFVHCNRVLDVFLRWLEKRQSPIRLCPFNVLFIILICSVLVFDRTYFSFLFQTVVPEYVHNMKIDVFQYPNACRCYHSMECSM